MEKSFNKSSQYIKEQYGQYYIQKTREIAKNHLASAANSPHVEWVIDVYVFFNKININFKIFKKC